MTLLPIHVQSGHNVTGNTSGVCPVCGTPIDGTGESDKP